MTELENLMSCFLWTQLNAYFSPSSLPNLSEEQNFSAANTNMVLNFPKLENHILVWKAFYVVHFNIGLLRSRVSKFTTVFCFSTMHTILIDIDMGGLHQSYLAIFDGASANNLISGLNF